MKTFDAATEEQKLRRLALQAIFVADFPFLKGSGSPDEESDSRRGSEFHEQQANCGGYSDKVSWLHNATNFSLRKVEAKTFGYCRWRRLTFRNRLIL